jgi:hypothetical protein
MARATRRARPGKAEPVQQAHAVRPDQHAGPDLADVCCLLVDRSLNARSGQRGGSREPADSATHYRHRQLLAHQDLPVSTTAILHKRI